MWPADNIQGLYSLRRCRLISIGIPIINMRRSSDHLRFVMGIPIHIRRCLLSELRPRSCMLMPVSSKLHGNGITFQADSLQVSGQPIWLAPKAVQCFVLACHFWYNIEYIVAIAKLEHSMRIYNMTLPTVWQFYRMNPDILWTQTRHPIAGLIGVLIVITGP